MSNLTYYLTYLDPTGIGLFVILMFVITFGVFARKAWS